MNPHVFALSESLSVQEAIERIQQQSSETETVFYLYVVDDFQNLVGVLSLRQLLMSKPQKKLKDVMTSDVMRVQTDTDQEEVARLVARNKLLSIPVVDPNNRLLGIITVDDVIDVLREEATEDFLKMAGVEEDALDLPSVFQSAKERLPWLAATLFGGMVASEIIGSYHDLFTRISILTGFIPVIIGMGGNLGTQSSTIVVRGLATGKIQHSQLWRLLWKEARVALALGGVYGIFFGLFAWFRFPSHANLGLVVGSSICLAMLIAVLVGTFIPIIFDRIRIDPAIATGPFVTTSVDILGCLTYLSIAYALL
jgi:magnesium transporter